MAKFFEKLTPELHEFIAAQSVFFTASAPCEGRVNVSPKGMDTFRCLNESQVAYLDLTGSGNETAAHLLENGRITIMFCSFSKRPLILRLYGHGHTLRPGCEKWQSLHGLFPPLPGARQIVLIDIDAVQTSCGYAVPLLDEPRERMTLREWAAKKGEDGITDYWREKNQTSIDGLPTGVLDRTD